MKPTEIKMQIVKNIGNFQSVRLEATYLLDSTSPTEIEDCFKKARFDLEKSFITIYSKNEMLILVEFLIHIALRFHRFRSYPI